MTRIGYDSRGSAELRVDSRDGGELLESSYLAEWTCELFRPAPSAGEGAMTPRKGQDDAAPHVDCSRRDGGVAGNSDLRMASGGGASAGDALHRGLHAAR